MADKNDIETMMKNMSSGKPATTNVDIDDLEVDDVDLLDDELDAEDTDSVEEDATAAVTAEGEQEVESADVEVETEDVVETPSSEDDPTKLKTALVKANRERNRLKRRVAEWQEFAVAASLESELSKAGFNGKIEKVSKLLDLSKVELKEGSIAGLEDQIKELKEDFPALFTVPAAVKPANTNVRKPAAKVEGTKPAAPAGDPNIMALIKSANRR